MGDTSYAVPPGKVDRVVTVHNRGTGVLVETPNAPPFRLRLRATAGSIQPRRTTSSSCRCCSTMVSPMASRF
jgi:hypothetical protein